MTLTRHIQDADLIEKSYLVGCYFGSTLNLISVNDLPDVDLNYEVIGTEDEDSYYPVWLIGKDDYRDLINRLNEMEIRYDK